MQNIKEGLIVLEKAIKLDFSIKAKAKQDLDFQEIKKLNEFYENYRVKNYLTYSLSGSWSGFIACFLFSAFSLISDNNRSCSSFSNSAGLLESSDMIVY